MGSSPPPLLSPLLSKRPPPLRWLPSKTSSVSSHLLDSTILSVCSTTLPRSDSTNSDTPNSSTDVSPCLPSSDSSPNTPESVSPETLTSKEPPSPPFPREPVPWPPSLREDGSSFSPLSSSSNSSCVTTLGMESSLVTSDPEPSTTDGTPSMRKRSSPSVPSSSTTDVPPCSESLDSWSTNSSETSEPSSLDFKFGMFVHSFNFSNNRQSLVRTLAL